MDIQQLFETENKLFLFSFYDLRTGQKQMVTFGQQADTFAEMFPKMKAFGLPVLQKDPIKFADYKETEKCIIQSLQKLTKPYATAIKENPETCLITDQLQTIVDQMEDYVDTVITLGLPAYIRKNSPIVLEQGEFINMEKFTELSQMAATVIKAAINAKFQQCLSLLAENFPQITDSRERLQLFNQINNEIVKQEASLQEQVIDLYITMNPSAKNLPRDAILHLYENIPESSIHDTLQQAMQHISRSQIKQMY